MSTLENCAEAQSTAEHYHRFTDLPADTDQKAIQEALQEIHRAGGLQVAMECLYAWQLGTDYLPPDRLTSNKRFHFPDPRLGIDFRLQINYARSNYQPRPVDQRLHCAICKENVGRPGKEQLRIYEFPLDERLFFLQLTPFPLFAYHFVLILSRPDPQRIDHQSVADMLCFLRLAPAYTVCSNSDVEWAGSSILEHLHYQVFKDLHLPVMEAAPLPKHSRSRSGCTLSLLNYPLAALRVSGPDEGAVRSLVGRLIALWKEADPGRNTVNLVLNRREEGLFFYILLRNPDFRTPPELQRFKQEGVGVIEAAGECILPVPTEPDGEEFIRQRGREIIMGIIAGNDPLPVPAQRRTLFEKLVEEL